MRYFRKYKDWLKEDNTLNEQAIEHINSRYRCSDVYITPDRRVGIRIRTGCEVNEVYLVYHDPYAYQDGRWVCQRTPMTCTGGLRGRKLFACEISCPTRRIKYFFILKDGKEELQYSEMGITRGYDVMYLPCFFVPYIYDEEILNVPSWIKKTIWYQIMPIRFYAGDDFQNGEGAETDGENRGTLKGIIQKLPYLQKLGINGIYLNPVFQAASYHKYDVTNYEKIDGHLGSREDFICMCREIHKRKMHLMLDVSLTHCSDQNPLWQDVLRNGRQSRYYSWFRVECKSDGTLDYETFAFEHGMPKFNTENPELTAYFADRVIVPWMKAGVDAWRFDVADEISDQMLQHLKAVMRSVDPQSVMIGEIWHNATEWIRPEELDGVTNYALSRAILSFVASPEHSADVYRSAVNDILGSYSPEQLKGCAGLLDSHDTPRIRTIFKDDIRKIKLALFLMMTFYGAPTIYYGTERYMAGGADPDCRHYPDWNDDSPRVREMTDFVRLLASMRTEYQELANEGSFDWRDSREILIFERSASKRLLIAVNCSEEEKYIHLPLPAGRQYRNVVNGDMVDTETRIEAFGFMVLDITSSETAVG